MFSDPVIGDEFFGRQAVLDLLHKRAIAIKSGYRQNVAIIGHQQVGKTSLLRQFLHTLDDQGLLAIYVEIKFQALDYFIDQFVRSLLFQFLRQTSAAPSPDSALPDLLLQAEPLIPKTVARIKEIAALIKQRHPEEAYSKLFELTSVIHSESGKSCIVILDEFHRLGEFGLRNAFSNFGKRIMLQKDTMYLLSSSSFSASKKILAEKLALLFGHFERIYLEPFDFETSFAFLDKKLAPYTVPAELKHFLVGLTDGHPFFLETITSRLREVAAGREAQTELGRRLVAEVLAKLLFESQGVLYQYFLKLISPWTRPGSRGSHVLTLAEMAKGRNKIKDLSAALNRSQAEVSRELTELMSHELIVKTGVFYRFHNKIFKFWLKEVYAKKELSLHGVSNVQEDFIRRVEETVAEYAEFLRMDAADRVSGLLSLFRNEIVELGEKRRQLPHFTEILSSPAGTSELKGSSRDLVASGHGRCWVCKVVEERATEREVLDLVSKQGESRRTAPTRVLVALNGVDDSAKLLAKEKRVLTLSLSRLNILMDIYGRSPVVRVRTETGNVPASA